MANTAYILKRNGETEDRLIYGNCHSYLRIEDFATGGENDCRAIFESLDDGIYKTSIQWSKRGPRSGMAFRKITKIDPHKEIAVLESRTVADPMSSIAGYESRKYSGLSSDASARRSFNSHAIYKLKGWIAQ